MNAATVAAAPSTMTLPVTVATGEALAPYGYLVGPPRSEVYGRIDYYGDEVQVRAPAKFVCNDDMQLNLVTFNRRAPVIRWKEYHTQHTQAFVPLAGRPFIMVPGPPTARRPDRSFDESVPDVPDLATVRAFYFDGSAAICVHIGTWHEVPFALVDGTGFVAIVTNETNRNLEEHDEHFESHGADLQKRQLERVQRFAAAIATRECISIAQAQKRLVRESAQQRIIEPAEIGRLAAWMLSDRFACATGNQVTADGGAVHGLF